MEQDKLVLPVKTPAQAVQEARAEIYKERDGKQLGLVTRYSSLNIAMRKYFRFNSVNLIAGLSGHGKSYFLNTLIEDFLDYKKDGINRSIDFIPVVLHFCFEMSSYNEILRACANDLGINYNYLLSSHYDKETKTYNKLTDDELRRAEEYLDYYASKSILFYEVSGNVKLIANTVESVVNAYKNKAVQYNTAHPDRKKREYKFIVNIDHTLLIETLAEKSALELMANVGKLSIRLRKEFGAMVNLIGQLNNNIEATDRILKPNLHYPQKSDIYAQGQLFNACDSVFVFHQPSMLKIAKYGPKGRDTQGLIHLLVLKARHGNIGSVWFLNHLHEGKIIELPKEDTTIHEDEMIDNV